MYPVKESFSKKTMMLSFSYTLIKIDTVSHHQSNQHTTTTLLLGVMNVSTLTNFLKPMCRSTGVTDIIKYTAWYTKFDKPITLGRLQMFAHQIEKTSNTFVCDIQKHSECGYTAYRHDIHDSTYIRLCNPLKPREMAAFIHGLHIGVAHTPMDLLNPNTDLVLSRHQIP